MSGYEIPKEDWEKLLSKGKELTELIIDISTRASKSHNLTMPQMMAANSLLLLVRIMNEALTNVLPKLVDAFTEELREAGLIP
jgi:hypothetical protein